MVREGRSESVCVCVYIDMAYLGWAYLYISLGSSIWPSFSFSLSRVLLSLSLPLSAFRSLWQSHLFIDSRSCVYIYTYVYCIIFVYSDVARRFFFVKKAILQLFLRFNGFISMDPNPLAPPPPPTTGTHVTAY